MTKRCVPCLTPDLRQAILSEVTDASIREVVSQIPDCGRKRSAYQEFVGSCMRGKHLKGLDPAAMKDCARQWRERAKLV